jgi:hypothetical protein
MQHLGDRRRQGRLAMIDMTHRPNIQMRLRPLKPLLRHARLISSSNRSGKRKVRAMPALTW